MMTMKGRRSFTALICVVPALPFSPQHRHLSTVSKPAACNQPHRSFCNNQRTRHGTIYYPSPSFTTLYGGIGIADTYQWEESQYEIDVTVLVPPGTRARDVKFKATPTGVDLKLESWNGDIRNDVILLDGKRKMRGRVSVDGTYWAIADGDKTHVSSKQSDADADEEDDRRQITVTIEKMIVEPQDQFEVVEFDWYGVYPDDDDEVKERKYDKAEELDVREYAASLGVDIDNINMSMVDKTMFSSGLNMTQSTMNELSKAGYVKEVTQQSGQEFVTGEDGEKIPFQSLGENIGADEIMNIDPGRLVSPDRGGAPTSDDVAIATATTAAATSSGGTSRIRSQLPFIDSHSKWHQSIPAEEARDEDGTPLDMGADDPSTSIESDTAEPTLDATETPNKEDADDTADAKAEAVDPVDLLTVKRLKEILKEQNLKVSGNKQELRDRLRAHVNSKLANEGE